MSNKKKIVHIVEAFGGGIFSFLVDLINETIDNYDITILYSKREQTPKDFEKCFDNRVKFIELKYLKREIHLKNEFKAIREVKNIIKNINPDIVHLHSAKAGIVGRFAVNSRKVKMLYNPHGFSFLMENASNVKRLVYWIIEKIATIKKCSIIACSNGEYKEALKLTKNAIRIDNGVNIKKLKSEIDMLQIKKFNSELLNICTVGRIDYQKNPKLFNSIAEKFPNIKFTWIGEGELEQELKSNNITVTGWKTRKEVLQILNNNDVFILPSLWEGLPIALLEAMYMKKICIVSNVIGNRDVIVNGKNGFIAFNDDDYENIINKLEKQNVEKIIEMAQKTVFDKYNFDNVAKKYLKIYAGKE